MPDVDGPQGLGAPIPTNTRAPAAAIFEQKTELEPWFGIEQEYTLFNLDKVTPLGWPQVHRPVTEKQTRPTALHIHTHTAHPRAPGLAL